MRRLTYPFIAFLTSTIGFALAYITLKGDSGAVIPPAPTPELNTVGTFKEGLACVRAGGKWGYIDVNGHVVIPFRFDMAYPFSEGLARVYAGDRDREGYIDRAGGMIIEPRFDGGGVVVDSDFHEGLAFVGLNGKWGYIDRTGQFVIKPQFAPPPFHAGGVESFSEGLAGVWINRKLGYIDRTGKIVIKPRFDLCNRFSHGLAYVEIGNKWDEHQRKGYIDKRGKFVWIKRE